LGSKKVRVSLGGQQKPRLDEAKKEVKLELEKGTQGREGEKQPRQSTNNIKKNGKTEEKTHVEKE